jgi:hypothetical protein
VTPIQVALLISGITAMVGTVGPFPLLATHGQLSPRFVLKMVPYLAWNSLVVLVALVVLWYLVRVHVVVVLEREAERIHVG